MPDKKCIEHAERLIKVEEGVKHLMNNDKKVESSIIRIKEDITDIKLSLEGLPFKIVFSITGIITFILTVVGFYFKFTS